MKESRHILKKTKKKKKKAGDKGGREIYHLTRKGVQNSCKRLEVSTPIQAPMLKQILNACASRHSSPFWFLSGVFFFPLLFLPHSLLKYNKSAADSVRRRSCKRQRDRQTDRKRLRQKSSPSVSHNVPVFWSWMDYASVWWEKNYCWWVPAHQGMAAGDMDLESPPQKPVRGRKKFICSHTISCLIIVLRQS